MLVLWSFLEQSSCPLCITYTLGFWLCWTGKLKAQCLSTFKDEKHWEENKKADQKNFSPLSLLPYGTIFASSFQPWKEEAINDLG